MKKWIPIILLIAASGCKSTQNLKSTEPVVNNYALGGKVYTSIFQQKAAEYRALCYQAYNIARLRIDNFQPLSNKPKAIITDIDETLLDNSPYAVKQAWQGKDYDVESWNEWTKLALADTLAGTAAFLNYAQSKNVEIFYITNRDEREREGTLANLKRFNLPNADNDHLLLRQNTSSKEVRRNKVMQTHEVILFMGDNLSDFSILFDKKIQNQRQINVDASWQDFGKKFIVLPNPNYGDWEGALTNYNYKITPAQKDSLYKAVLKTY